MSHRIISMADLDDGAPYRLLTGLVIPRPIAWVSSVDASGVLNLAPHSFFTVASANPPIVQFTSVGRKDSLRNIESTGEFVVNLAPRMLIEPMNTTAARVDPEVDEFDLAELTPAGSTRVKPPRVAESPAALECVLHSVIPVGNSFLVLGEVVGAVVDEEMLDGDRPNESKLDPLGRLSGSRYVTFGETVSVPRPER